MLVAVTRKTAVTLSLVAQLAVAPVTQIAGIAPLDPIDEEAQLWRSMRIMIMSGAKPNFSVGHVSMLFPAPAFA
jgi:UDP-3-O-[3-hydroxymyristoyl] glucosamine N-acyltransferase